MRGVTPIILLCLGLCSCGSADPKSPESVEAPAFIPTFVGRYIWLEGVVSNTPVPQLWGVDLWSLDQLAGHRVRVTGILQGNAGQASRFDSDAVGPACLSGIVGVDPRDSQTNMNNIQFREVVDSKGVNWESEAEKLAEAGTPFVLVGFSYPHHVHFYNQLALRFDLESRFEPNKQRAYFWKK